MLHPDVVALFGWHDGFDLARWNDDEVSLPLLPGFEFRPLYDALERDLIEDVRATQQAGTLAVADGGLIAGSWSPDGGLG